MNCVQGSAGAEIAIAGGASLGYLSNMKRLRYVFWQDGEWWLGHLEEYPDYLTQGESLEDLKDQLRDLYTDLSGGHIPSARKTAVLEVA